MADKQDIEKFSNSVSSFKDTIEKYRDGTANMGNFGKSVNEFEKSVRRSERSRAAAAKRQRDENGKFIASIESASPNAKIQYRKVKRRC